MKHQKHRKHFGPTSQQFDFETSNTLTPEPHKTLYLNQTESKRATSFPEFKNIEYSRFQSRINNVFEPEYSQYL